MYKPLYITLLLLFTAAAVQAQRLPERSLVRKGTRQYNKGNYEQAIGRYEEALKAAPGQFEATYDLGNALYKAERFDRAEQTMMQAAADSLRSDTERAEAFYNLGNAQFRQQKYKEALESYKQSLRLNPGDMEAKYNYAYTKRLLDQNQDQNGSGGNDQQNQDQPTEPERPESGPKPESGPERAGSAGSTEPAESARPTGSERRSGLPETRPAAGGRRAAHPLGNLPAGAGADARRHPGPGGPHAGETQREEQGGRGPRP